MKNGSLKLASWNVNGLRACMGKGFPQFLEAESPDVLCLQETKMQREQADFQFPGYHEYWNSATTRKGYSGTAIFSKTEPLSVTYGIGREEFDGEGRVIAAEYEEFLLVTVYTPNAQRDLARIQYRMAFEDAFREYLSGASSPSCWPAALWTASATSTPTWRGPTPGGATWGPPGRTIPGGASTTSWPTSAWCPSWRTAAFCPR